MGREDYGLFNRIVYDINKWVTKMLDKNDPGFAERVVENCKKGRFEDSVINRKAQCDGSEAALKEIQEEKNPDHGLGGRKIPRESETPQR